MAPTPTAFSRVPGGKYQCRENDDGTFDVLDVPFFSTVPKGVKGAPRDITEEDLNLSVEIHKKQFTDDQFLARVNILHNYGSQKAMGAGFFLPKRVGKMRLGGKTRAVVFCDLLHIKAPYFEMIDADELPYRSAEVREWEPLQFGALALLDTEPPFYQFPMLTTGEKVLATDSVGHEIFRFDSAGSPAVAAFHGKAGSAYLFRFQEEDPMPEDLPDKDKNEEAQMEDAGFDIKPIVKAITSGEISVKDMAAIVEAVQSQAAEAPVEPEAEPEEDLGGQETPVELADKDEDEEKKPEFSAKMEGRLAAMEDKVAAFEAEKQRDALFGAAIKGLESDGYGNISDATRARLLKAADAGKETLSLFTDGYRETTPREPGQTLEGGPSPDVYPTEVMAFANAGPDSFTEAKRHFREWEELPDDGMRSTLERYLTRNVQKGA